MPLFLRGALVRERHDIQLSGGFIEHEFKPANAAAVDPLRLRPIAMGPDLNFARRTLPRHGGGILGQAEIRIQDC